MEFINGVLTALCVVLAALVVWGRNHLLLKLAEIHKNMAAINETVAKMPVVQNVIHLGLKEGRFKTGVAATRLPIRPEDFQVNAEKLYNRLVHGLKVKDHDDVGVRAYCIFNHAGLPDILEGGSKREAEKALTRLLINADEEAIKRFFRTIADSVSELQMKAAEENPETVQ